MLQKFERVGREAGFVGLMYKMIFDFARITYSGKGSHFNLRKENC